MKFKIKPVAVATQAMLLSIFVLEAAEKWHAGGAPQWFGEGFASTWVARLPGGLDFSWFLIAIVETAIAAGAAISLVRGEWHGKKRHDILRATLFVTLLLFVMLGFGGRISGRFDIAAHAFAYFSGFLLAFHILDKDPGRAK